MKKLFLFLRDGKLFYGSSLDDATALEVVNRELIADVVLMQEGHVYEVAKGWTEEIDEQEESCGQPCEDYNDVCQYSGCAWKGRKFARLIPLKEQYSGIVATGVPEHGDKFEVLLYGEWVELSENQYLQAINNNHYGRVNGIEQHRKPVSPPPKAESEDYEAKPLLGDAIYNALMSTTKFLPSEATDLAITITGELINGLSKDFTITRKP